LSSRVPTVYNEMYISLMEPKNVDLLMQIREAKRIDALKRMIFNFPSEFIMRSLNEGRSIRSILKEENIDPTPYYGELRDYQTTGVAFMYYSPRSIISDGVGMGKTAQISGLINFLKSKGEMTRFMIAVETSAVNQTITELIKFTGLRVIGLPSTKDKLLRAIDKTDWDNVDGVVIKHSALRSPTLSSFLALNIFYDEQAGKEVNRLFDTFFLDESSVIKNSGNKIYEYTKNICDISKRVHFMNATAFEKHLLDVYNQMDMMDPNLLPAVSRIKSAYCNYKKGHFWKTENGVPVRKTKFDHQGYKNQEEFKKSLKAVYFGRSTKDVGLDKPHVYRVYEVEATDRQKHAIKSGHRYQEVLNCPSLIADMGVDTNRVSVPKLDRLVDLVEKDFHGDQVMVYAFHIEAQGAIAEEMYKIGRKPAILNGNTPDEDRWEIQTGFNSGKYDVIITNLQKSLNLNGGDVLIYYSASGNVASMEQIRGRIDRHTDDRVKTFILLLYKDTPEHDFFLQKTKQRAIDSRRLTIDAEGAIDMFVKSMEESE